MSRRCRMDLDGSSRSFLLAWTTWICRLTLSTSWRQWLWYTRYATPMMTTIARSHRSRRNYHLYQRPQWMSAHSTTARHHTPVPTTIRSIQAMSLDESTGISRQMKILPLVFQGIHQLPRALVLPRRLQEHRKESWAWECPFQKAGECRSTSAKPTGRRSPQQRTSQVRQAEIRTVPVSNLLSELLN